MRVYGTYARNSARQRSAQAGRSRAPLQFWTLQVPARFAYRVLGALPPSPFGRPPRSFSGQVKQQGRAFPC